MNKLLTFILLSIFLTVHIETLFLILQLNGRKMEKWLGYNAFKFHASITSLMWILTFILIIFLQFKTHPHFHELQYLRYIGILLVGIGIFIAVWGFIILGFKRSMCLNFYEEDIGVVKARLYKYIRNPQGYGLWILLLGYALFSASWFNLIIGLEFIIVMIPHIYIENISVKYTNNREYISEI